MRDHQNYFAVEDAAGKLAPYFLAVLNTEADEAGQAVIRHGNERVLRARFNDARFFWEFDQRTPLAGRVALLENVTFQKELGSYRAKTERVRRLASELAGIAGGVNAVALDEAALLAKTDLTAELVKEFTELQGVVGGLYARAQGASEAAAVAIYDQYLPTSMEDSVPRTAEGALLAIADKADTIAGMFGLGLEPTGSKDPFALRRAANGIVKILAETPVSLTLGEIAFLAATGKEEVVRKMELFFAERLEFYLREAKGQAYDVVKAVLAVRADGVRDAVARAEAVTAVRGGADFAAVSAAFKRMKNILSQATEKGFVAAAAVNVALLTDQAELALAEAAAELAPRVASLRGAGDYVGALEAIAGLRPQVDAFFEAVMVMSPDEAVRGNRLALLGKVLGDFSGIAEFSEIVVAG
jgi:glycyl-tRNA synthetase beta chain